MMRDYLAARRRAKQAENRVQYYHHGERLRIAAEKSKHARNVKLNDQSCSLHFHWHGSSISYMITTGSLSVARGGRTVLRTGVTPDKLLYLFTYMPPSVAFPQDGDLP